MAKLLIWDTETGGLDPSMNSILTLGAVVWDNGKVLDDEFAITIAEPFINAQPAALRVNGLDLKVVMTTGLAPAEAVDALETYQRRHGLANSRMEVGGHNVAFDVGFIQRLYRLAGKNYHSRYSHNVMCTQRIAGFLKLAGRLPIPNLTANALFEYFGIEANRADGVHRAVDDARATGHALTKLCELVQIPSLGNNEEEGCQKEDCCCKEDRPQEDNGEAGASGEASGS